MSKPVSADTSGIDGALATLLARLVSYDTTSHLSNLALVEFVRGYLGEHGVESQLFFDDSGEKANLHAVIGPNVDGGVGLSGHTDVVPVTGQNWTTDPFSMGARDGRFYGRGTTDMKGFLACVLYCVPHFKQLELNRPVHILFSYDEEIGCIGVRPMISEMGEAFARPSCVIVGEPTSMRVVDAHKGPGLWTIAIRGRSAHSSMPALGVNAVEYAGVILGELAALAADLRRASRDERFDPPYSSLQVTTINGGSASNIIPAACEIEFGVRALPGYAIAEVEHRLRAFIDETCVPKMRAVAPGSDITLKLDNHVPPFASAPLSPAVALALAAGGQNETFAVSYATEAGLFEEAGAPAVVCGPGDIAQAHTADEWVEESELIACVSFLKRLVDIHCR